MIPKFRFDEGKGIHLADGQDDLVAGNEDRRFGGRAPDGGGRSPSYSAVIFWNFMPTSRAFFHHKFERRMVVDDGDAFLLGVFDLPGGGLHLRPRAADDDLHLVRPQPFGGAAAVHGGIAAAKDQHPRAAADDMAVEDAGQPFDADEDRGGAFLAAGQIRQVAAARGAGADEDGVVALVDDLFQAVDIVVEDSVVTPMVRMRSTSSFRTFSGRRKEGTWVRMKPPALL